MVTKLYLAYGSNLHRSQMRRRCPDARPIGRILLKDHRLVFRGVADVEYKKGAEVPCGVWSISKADEKQLDTYEGYNKSGNGMYDKDYIKVNWRGERHEALIYLMNSTGIHPPGEYYANVIRQGYEDFNMDKKYLKEAIEHSFTARNHDRQTRERRKRQLGDPLNFRLVKREEALTVETEGEDK